MLENNMVMQCQMLVLFVVPLRESSIAVICRMMCCLLRNLYGQVTALRFTKSQAAVVPIDFVTNCCGPIHMH